MIGNRRQEGDLYVEHLRKTIEALHVLCETLRNENENLRIALADERGKSSYLRSQLDIVDGVKP